MTVRRDERGAILVISALVITALLVIVAIVIDLGATRSDRRGGQLAVDNAAAAAGQAIADANAAAGCQAAIDFLEVTLEQTFTGYDCSGFAACPGGSPVVASANGYTATLYHPVPDDSPLMASPSAIGATSGSFASDLPGDECDRFGVQLTTTGDSFFGGVVGQDGRTSTVHAVITVTPPDEGGRLINLAVLHRTDCDVLTTSGNGGVTAGAIVDLVDGTLPGNISVDSDGSNCGNANDATVTLGGSNALVRADGDTGCDGELPSGPGHGCGDIYLYAEGAPGCNPIACDESTGTVAPSPDRVLELLTRAPVDHRWNCKSSYATESWSSEQPIPGCSDTATKEPYIDQLKAAVDTSGTPAGWNTYPDSECSIEPSDPPVVKTGNWHVPCDLTIRGSLTFTGGNVIFDGDVTLRSSGVLTVNSANTNLPDPTDPWVEGDALDIDASYATESFVYFRDGEIDKAAQSSVIFNRVMGYFSSTSTLTFAGGSTGTVSWTAPTTGPFPDLALWSDGTDKMSFGGSSGMVLDGAYFVPLATVEYRGNGGNDVTAQFIAEKLDAVGNGYLRLTPTRGVEAPPRPTVVTFIR